MPGNFSFVTFRGGLTTLVLNCGNVKVVQSQLAAAAASKDGCTLPCRF